MALAFVTPSRNAPDFSHFNPAVLTHAGHLISRTNLIIPKGNNVVFNPFGLKNVKTCSNRRKKSEMIPRLAVDSEANIEGPSLSDIIKRFYRCINKNDRKGLEDLIYRNCLLEDSSFPYVIQGKKEVVNLFIQLAESMGENVEFKLGTVCEGDELTASVNWHLEWMDDQIPFSRGCSIFQCTNEGEKLVIRKAQIITESPIKPGIFAMALLKMVTSFFNDFPSAAKWILRSPHTILKAMLNMYGLFLAPIINPVLTFYITLWKFIARILGYVISFLHVIGKYFNKKSSTDDNDSNTSSLEIDQGPSSLP